MIRHVFLLALLAIVVPSTTVGQKHSLTQAGGGFNPMPSREGSVPLGTEPPTESCSAQMMRVHNLCSSRQTAAEGYDTAKQVLRECLTEPGACGIFGDMYAAAQKLGENDRWLDLRNFLKESWSWAPSDPQNADCWFCSNLAVLADCYHFYDRPNLEHEDFNGEVAILDFILTSGRCPTDSQWIYQRRRSARESQWIRWVDTVKDAQATPLDTGAVTLESLGLGYVLAAAAEATPRGASAILSFLAMRNPSHRDFTLRLEVSKPSAILIEVFDVLGNRVWYSNRESIDAGFRTYGVTLPDASGTYFARVSTPSGEARTIRLVRN